MNTSGYFMVWGFSSLVGDLCVFLGVSRGKECVLLTKFYLVACCFGKMSKIFNPVFIRFSYSTRD